MAVTIKQTEGVPATWPAVPSGLSTAAAALAPALVWGRIEAWIAFRWTARDVAWVVEGPGEWVPPLSPETITATEVWSAADEWETVTLSPSPLGGYRLPATGPYRFTATVGGGTVPAAATEAYRRLAEYVAAKPGKAGASSESIAAGSITISHTRSAEWLARAMQNSGAADLLRPYRRVR